MADLQVGDKVLYVPHNDHHLDTGRDNQLLFHFAHVGKDGTPGPRVDNMGRLGLIAGRDADKNLVINSGAVVRHDGPLFFWPATVTEVKPDGKVGLEIPHPSGRNTLYYTVPHDPAKKPHTCHRAEE